MKYIICGGIDILITSAEIVALSQDSEHNKKLAFIDGLTSIRKRTAYSVAIAEIKMEEQKRDSFGVVVIDINNIKRMNDNYGHNRGDQAIIESASILEKCFGKEDYCYRWSKLIES